jgi:hypothetical protein
VADDTIICPCCAARFTLDVAVSDVDARFCLQQAYVVPGALGPLVIRYLRLFTTKGRALRWSKHRRLVEELLPMFLHQVVERNGQQLPCSQLLWHEALSSLTERSDKLKLPLTTHGYLLEIAMSLAEQAAAKAEEDHEKSKRIGQVKAREFTPSGVSPAAPDSEETRARAKKDFDAFMGSFGKA